ncbi:MAG: alpha-2-macroglobulin family protein, partial [Armatimonadota bacterium]
IPTGEGGADGENKIFARSGESAAFVSAYMSSYERAKQVVYAYTDRPVYRPGQKVYFKGVIRSREHDRYAVPAGKNVIVEVRDPNDTLVYRAGKTTDRFGCYHGELKLNPEAATGTYTMVTTVGAEEEQTQGDETGSTFQVAAYAKPEFSVKVTFPKKRYTRGEMIRATVKAEYYFGAPVANARVSYNVTRSDYWLDQSEENEYDYEGYEDYGGYGDLVEEGQVRTDRNGEAEISFRAEWPEPEEEYGWDTDQQFTLEAYVVDASRREAQGSGDVIATRGDFALTVTPGRYVARPGSAVRVDITATDYEKRPVANQEIRVIIGREYWTGRDLEFRKSEERTVTTDASGRAALEFAPKNAGDVRIAAVTRDRRGNRIVGSAWLWCYSEAYEEVEGVRYPDLKIITDKKTYAPGETARVLINAARPGAVALVTVEGEQIYDQMTVRLSRRTTAVDIPVRDSYKPNFYIGVCFVRDKQFASQQARVRVSLAVQSISVAVEPNKTRYLPGEKATYRIKTTDAAGRPVEAQVSLGVVDEAIYAIRADDTIPILDYFYSRKPNDVSTRFSFPEIYLSDPDKAAMEAKMPRQTAMRIRKRFLDTAFWMPDITTGPAGEATVSFTMPDNLTTWRATARAVTLDTRCGQTTTSVLAQQDMLVRLETPRFLIQGDRTTISAVVHNYTGAADSVSVRLRAPDLDVEGRHSGTVVVPDGESRRVDWAVRALKPGEFQLTVTARGDKAGDAMQLTIPVYPHGEERRLVRTGAMRAEGRSTIVVPVRGDSI